MALTNEKTPMGEGGLHDSHGHKHTGLEHYNDNQLLEEITKNLPGDVCPAHGMMILFIKNSNKNSTRRFDELDKKIDPIVGFVLQKKIEEEAQDLLEKKETKTDSKNKDKNDNYYKIIAILITMISIVYGIGSSKGWF